MPREAPLAPRGAFDPPTTPRAMPVTDAAVSAAPAGVAPGVLRRRERAAPVFSSSQPAQVMLRDPAKPSDAPAGTPANAEGSTSDSSSGEPAGEDKRADPTEHPLVKGVMAQFAAKILEVRKKE